jgi:TetR/AcrR family transcriptional regulator, transcriptional repressor for nem operon
MRTANTDSLTRRKLLDAAQELMLAKGFVATSVDDICAAAGVTKGSFFHYFTDKEHLGRVVAEHFYTARQEMFATAPFLQKTDPLDRVLGFIDFFIAGVRRSKTVPACLLGTFVQELSQTHPKIRSVCASCFEDTAERFQHELDAAKAKYAPDARWNTQSVAEHFVAVAQGSIIVAKAKQDKTVLVEGLEHFREYVKCLLGA